MGWWVLGILLFGGWLLVAAWLFVGFLHDEAGEFEDGESAGVCLLAALCWPVFAAIGLFTRAADALRGVK